MSNYYVQSDFEFEEDYVIMGECQSCGNTTEDRDEVEEGVCSECGGELIVETSHEGRLCQICNHTFDMFESAYAHKKDSDVYICEDCHENLTED